MGRSSQVCFTSVASRALVSKIDLLDKSNERMVMHPQLSKAAFPDNCNRQQVDTNEVTTDLFEHQTRTVCLPVLLVSPRPCLCHCSPAAAAVSNRDPCPVPAVRLSVHLHSAVQNAFFLHIHFSSLVGPWLGPSVGRAGAGSGARPGPAGLRGLGARGPSALDPGPQRARRDEGLSPSGPIPRTRHWHVLKMTRAQGR